MIRFSMNRLNDIFFICSTFSQKIIPNFKGAKIKYISTKNSSSFHFGTKVIKDYFKRKTFAFNQINHGRKVLRAEFVVC